MNTISMGLTKYTYIYIGNRFFNYIFEIVVIQASDNSTIESYVSLFLK